MKISLRTMWRISGFLLGLAGFAVLSFSAARAAEASCGKTLGDKQAERLVYECIMTMTSYHAPCNAKNPCSLIEDSIKVGCRVWRDSASYGLTERELRRLKPPPKYCAKYLAGP